MAIQLSNEQLTKLDGYAFENYISELVEHCEQCYPKLINQTSTIELRKILAEAVDEAKQEGVNQRASVRFYIDLIILFGAGFKTDPQYAWISQWLKQNAHYTQLEQADFLFFDCVDHLQTVYGENNINKYKAGNKLELFDLANYMMTKETFDHDLLAILKDIYPEKAAIAGDNALQTLINQAKQAAMEQFHYTRTDQYAYFVIVSYLYGHQFNTDIFLPSVHALKNTSNEVGNYIDNRVAINQRFMQAIQNWSTLKSI